MNGIRLIDGQNNVNIPSARGAGSGLAGQSVKFVHSSKV